MKKVIAIVAICLSKCILPSASAQSDSIRVKYFRLDSVTAIGKPNGEAVSQEIDKDGGTIFSDDGRLKLTIPEGALNKKKKITIQSVSNLAANGNGNAYRLEPSGTTFQKPATLVFNYSADELIGTSAEFKSIAWQDDKGKWEAMREIKLDTAAKTITTQINHFSSYASFDKLVLLPRQARVKVEKIKQMEIHFVLNYLDDDIALPPTIPTPEWTVNGMTYGNSDVGTITPLITNHAKYTAPVSVPEDNPVAVGAKLNGMEFRFNGTVYRNPSLVSHLLIYDKAYRISINMWVDNSEDGMCTMRGEDRGEFTVVLEGTRSMIKEINNENFSLRFNSCPCTFTWRNRPIPGPINVIGASKIDVTPASLPSVPFRKVRIMLKHGYSPLPDIKVGCPARGGVPTGAAFASVFLPPMIEFEAKDDPEQRFTLSELSRGSLSNNRRNGLTILIKLIEE